MNRISDPPPVTVAASINKFGVKLALPTMVTFKKRDCLIRRCLISASIAPPRWKTGSRRRRKTLIPAFAGMTRRNLSDLLEFALSPPCC